MSSDLNDPDLVATVTPAAAGATRRLTTKEKVKAILEITVTTYDDVIDAYIDRVSDEAAGYCGLAEDNAGTGPTFGAETLRATWYAYSGCREGNLLLPWRPVIAISSLTEAGTALVANTDYRLLKTGELVRLCNGFPFWWNPCLQVIATFTCGWTLPAGVPPALEGQVIEQVKTRFLGRKRDPALRAEATQDVGSASYGVIGGDSISEGGMLKSLEGALDDYRRALV